jgi:nucleoside-diphosphate-sugar epimerase
MNLFVTGASGFVGSRLCLEASLRGFIVRKAARNICSEDISRYMLIKDNDLIGCDVVVHLGARVHITRENAADPLAEFRLANTLTTITLAKQAAKAGVKRFVFVSTVKVNGESTQGGSYFTDQDIPAPDDAYALSKMEAELSLREIALNTGMELVIIRPPLVYGQGVKANFALLMRCIKLGLPLPFGAIYNLRSLVSLGNLVDLILTCTSHSAAANQTFMVSDGEDVSTTDLLRRLGLALGRRPCLISVPESLLKVTARLLGKSGIARRLCESLQVDISKTRKLLGWTPPQTLDEGLAEAARGMDEALF